MSAMSFVHALMFTLSSQSKTSLTDLTSDIYRNFGTDISKEALHKRFNEQAVVFLKALIQTQLSNQLSAVQSKAALPFIKIKDSTRFSLPQSYKGCYPGFGNFSKKNGMMTLQYEYDLISGQWESIETVNCRRNDQQDSKLTIDSIQKGGLYIRDLGYVSPTYLQAILAKKAHFLNRIPPQASIYAHEGGRLNWADIDKKMNKLKMTAMEMNVFIYEKHKIPCRIIVERLNNEAYKNRLEHAKKSARSRKVNVSDEHKRRCRYNVFITSLSAQELPLDRIRETYGLRWQIELVFKTWKSFFEINKVKNIKKERLECQLLGKLLWILLNWQLFNKFNQAIKYQNPGKGVSVIKFFKRSISFSYSLQDLLLKRYQPKNWVKSIFIPSIRDTLCEPAAKKKTHYQLLKPLLIPLG